jgi:hypothetical protein
MINHPQTYNPLPRQHIQTRMKTAHSYAAQLQQSRLLDQRCATVLAEDAIRHENVRHER